MRQKILMGSMLVLTLLLLMPAIPAIQVNSIESATRNEKVNKINDLDFKEDIIDIFKTGQIPKHLLLFLIVWIVTNFRILRSNIFFEISTVRCNSTCKWPHRHITIKYPFLFLRSLLLFFTTDLWSEFWIFVSCTLGWNWYQ